jgi:[ribosomal protein S5]-alanine N-acetyltransferase
MTTLFTQRLVLTPYSVKDIDELTTIMGNAQVMAHIGKGPLSPEEVAAVVEKAIQSWQQSGMGWWILRQKSDGNAIGQMCLKPLTELPEIEIGYALAPQSWGQGYADEAMSVVLSHTKVMRLLKRVVALVRPANTFSVGFLKRNGFEFEQEFFLRNKTLYLYSQRLG